MIVKSAKSGVKLQQSINQYYLSPFVREAYLHGSVTDHFIYYITLN